MVAQAAAVVGLRAPWRNVNDEDANAVRTSGV